MLHGAGWLTLIVCRLSEIHTTEAVEAFLDRSGKNHLKAHLAPRHRTPGNEFGTCVLLLVRHVCRVPGNARLCSNSLGIAS